jgi:hypothetical protein
LTFWEPVHLSAFLQAAERGISSRAPDRLYRPPIALLSL